MSPLFLVNWDRVHGHFRALMWLVAIALAVAILVGASHGSAAAHPGTTHGVSPHVVAGTGRQPAQ